MSHFRVISGGELRHVVAKAAGINVAVSVTLRHRNRWATYASWIIAEHGDVLWIDMPVVDGGLVDHPFDKGERICVSYRLGERRYVGMVEVLGLEAYQIDELTRSLAIRVSVPPELRLIERRLMDRISLPTRQIARATVWLGGRDVSAVSGGDADAPCWSGKIINISSGGVYMRTNHEARNYMEVGDLVGIRLNFGPDREDVLLDAQLRHFEPDDDMMLIGFQFVLVDSDSPAALAALAAVQEIVAEYGGSAGKKSSRRPAGA